MTLADLDEAITLLISSRPKHPLCNMCGERHEYLVGPRWMLDGFLRYVGVRYCHLLLDPLALP